MNDTQVGRGLLAAFEHILVISLRRSVQRRQWVADELGRFGLRLGADFSFVDAADCRTYGRWDFLPELQAALPRNHNASGQQAVPWMRKPCNGTWHPSCSDVEHRRCLRRTMGPDLAAKRCGEICYSLSVARALQQFLASNRSRTLLLEDDICATSYLRRSRPLLARMAAEHRWKVVKMGHCFLNEGRRNITEPVCARGNAPANLAPNGHSNHLMAGLGNSFCAHTLGLTRKGASALLRLAFPVSAVFDDILAALGGRFGPRHQLQTLRAAGLQTLDDLGARHFKYSIFGQLSRQGGQSGGVQAGFTSIINADTQRILGGGR